jgi:FAD/FMN-containing dehydrogenase
MDLLSRAKAQGGGALEAFELMSRLNVDLAIAHIPGVRDPLDGRHPWYVLVELSGPDPVRAGEAMETLLMAAFERGDVADAVIAQSDQQRSEFWRLREEQTAAQRAEGASWSHDVSVPLSRVSDFLSRAGAAVADLFPGARPIPFGHAGDGNIHYNVVQPSGGDPAAFAAAGKQAARMIHAIVADLGGSISAEHGLGRMKTEDALRTKSAPELQAMRAVRAALDPHRIMNPGVLF